MTHLRFDFADSEVAAAWRRDDESRVHGAVRHRELALRFSAAHLVRTDTDDGPVPRPVHGHMRAVELVFRGSAVPAPGSEHVGLLTDGRVCADGTWHRVIDLPCVLNGPLSVELSFANHQRLVFDADELRVVLPEPAVFTESMAC